ncbi:MAG: indolepyruvate oxidoreductase subunit beta family protein [Rhizobiaceae bacterium]
MSAKGERAGTLRLLIAALGGEGGGVLMNWVVEAARNAGHAVQATSVPGVAQRTGSTSYYIEISREADEGTKAPVLSLVPMPGRVDILISSELVETARALAAGFVSPDRTTVISSTARVFSTAEKIEMGDGRYSQENVTRAVEELSHENMMLDLGQLATDNGTFVSATMFGALAGSGTLPWAVAQSRSVLADKRSMAGFDAAASAVNALRSTSNELEAARSELPAELQNVLDLGRARCEDFQDTAHGELYAERARTLIGLANLDDPQCANAVTEAARRLALWMAYEDVARVADLKTRPERFVTIRKEVQLQPGQLMTVTEYLKPRAEEVADILPARIGRRIMTRVERGKGLPFLGRGVHLKSNGVMGYWMLRAMASLHLIRRRSLRFGEEQEAIVVWLEMMQKALKSSPQFAEGLAELPRVLKGYSDTLARGRIAYNRIVSELIRPAMESGDLEPVAGQLRAAIAAALADENHKKLDTVLAATVSNSTVNPNNQEATLNE